MARLERDAQRICARFRLRYRVLEPERANVKRRYGVCFSDGTIRIRLTHVTTKQPLKYSSLVNTLCHELAHLRHFNHGPRFQTFYAQILEWARLEGIYRPGPEPKPLVRAAAPKGARKAAGKVATPSETGPVQLDVFAAARAAHGKRAAQTPKRLRPAPQAKPKPQGGQLELFR